MDVENKFPDIQNSDLLVNKGGWKAACSILSMEVCERLATLGIALNLVTYLHDRMHLSIPASANVVTNYLGTSCATCLIGGFLADAYFGRYKTIIVGSFIQFLGLILMVLSASLKILSPPPCDILLSVSSCKPATLQQMLVIYGGLFMIALGTGGIKSSVSGLGADQFDEGCVKGRQEMQSYFNWFGLSISMASIIAVTILVYVQDYQGRGIGYGISLCCMVISIFIFIYNSKLYNTKPALGSPLTQIAQVLVASWRNRHCLLQEVSNGIDNHSIIASMHSSSTLNNKNYMDSVVEWRFHRKSQFSCLDKATIASKSIDVDLTHSSWKYSSIDKVQEVKMFLQLLPILASTAIFWTTYAQLATFSIEQGATLDRKLGRNFEIPPASLAAFMQVSIMVTLLIYDRILIPIMKAKKRNEYGITSLQRIGIGLIFSTLSMVVAALIERKRLQTAHVIQKSKHATIILPMSVFYLVPQYVLTGIADALIYVGQLDLFYRDSPNSMRSFTTGLSLGSFSIGFFLSSALVSSVNKWTTHGTNPGWLPNDLNRGRLDCFYLLLAFCSFSSFLIFLLFSNLYMYNNPWIKSTRCDERATKT